MTGAASTLLTRTLAGERAALARLLTALDDDAPGARDLAAQLAQRAGRARVVGITGVPGSGKSTLVSVLLGAWLARGERVAVVAIDPSSPLTGGAVLGDRIRMGQHGAHPNAFIRSFSARGELGGLSRATRAAVDAFDAAGFDRVVIETVGAGQSETAIAAMADTRIVVCPPGLGDDVQALKAGILEIADLLVVNKADLPHADDTQRELQDMLGLRRAAAGTWRPRVLLVSATQERGTDELVAVIDEHRATLSAARRLTPDGAGISSPSTPARAPSSTGPRAPDIPVPADPHDSAAWLARLRALAGRDGLCAALGFEVTAGGPGRAEVQLLVEARHLNFNGGCHGGTMFALADTAFGLASNSHGPLAVGIDTHMTFQAGVFAGDRLIARAVEDSRSRRIAVYRVELVVRSMQTAQETRVANFTGTVYIK